MEYIVVIALFILVISLGVYGSLEPIMEDKKVRNNVRNSDSLTQHYCFLLDSDQAVAINQLALHNVKDVLEYTFDADSQTITFWQFGTSIEHKLSFYVVENKTYLKVSRVKYMCSRSDIPIKINRFFIEKIGAVPVDYATFEAVIDTSAN